VASAAAKQIVHTMARQLNFAADRAGGTACDAMQEVEPAAVDEPAVCSSVHAPIGNS
jgi:hypothetical protein